MRIYTKAGDLAFKILTFSDSQPHFELLTHDSSFNAATVEMALATPSDLLMAAMVADALRRSGFTEIRLDCRYLLGARMDRALSPSEPFTLEVVAKWINSMGWNKVRILDAHSDVATRLIRNSENLLPHQVVAQVVKTLGHVAIVVPDKGAHSRVAKLGQGIQIICTKTRNPHDGKLLAFGIDVGREFIHEERPDCLIIDDICDGGGTFTGIAERLKIEGAGKVHLFVTHGIFSRGLNLPGINHIFTTNSYYTGESRDNLTLVPISMEKL